MADCALPDPVGSIVSRELELSAWAPALLDAGQLVPAQDHRLTVRQLNIRVSSGQTPHIAGQLSFGFHSEIETKLALRGIRREEHKHGSCLNIIIFHSCNGCIVKKYLYKRPPIHTCCYDFVYKIYTQMCTFLIHSVYFQPHWNAVNCQSCQWRVAGSCAWSAAPGRGWTWSGSWPGGRPRCPASRRGCASRWRPPDSSPPSGWQSPRWRWWNLEINFYNTDTTRNNMVN